MFERFTERGRQVVVLAQEEARLLNHGYIGTEHLLLGLMREQEGLAARSLRSLGLTADGVWAEVVRFVGRGAEPSGGQIPFTPQAKKVLELSLRESQSLGHHQIGTEHILLALVREPEGAAARILLRFDADPRTVRDEVTRMLRGPGAAHVRIAVSGIDAWSEGLASHLGLLGREIDRTLDRDPDSGDILLVLACTQETLAGQVLAELGVDLDALQAAVERTRDKRGSASDEIDRKVEEVRQAKEEAIEAGDHEKAAKLRDRERELSAQPRAAKLVGSDALNDFRRRIGLPPDPA